MTFPSETRLIEPLDLRLGASQDTTEPGEGLGAVRFPLPLGGGASALFPLGPMPMGTYRIGFIARTTLPPDGDIDVFDVEVYVGVDVVASGIIYDAAAGDVPQLEYPERDEAVGWLEADLLDDTQDSAVRVTRGGAGFQTAGTLWIKQLVLERRTAFYFAPTLDYRNLAQGQNDENLSGILPILADPAERDWTEPGEARGAVRLSIDPMELPAVTFPIGPLQTGDHRVRFIARSSIALADGTWLFDVQVWQGNTQVVPRPGAGPGIGRLYNPFEEPQTTYPSRDGVAEAFAGRVDGLIITDAQTDVEVRIQRRGALGQAGASLWIKELRLERIHALVPPTLTNLRGEFMPPLSGDGSNFVDCLVTWTTSAFSDSELEWSHNNGASWNPLRDGTLTQAHRLFARNVNPGADFLVRNVRSTWAGGTGTLPDQSLGTSPARPTITLVGAPELTPTSIEHDAEIDMPTRDVVTQWGIAPQFDQVTPTVPPATAAPGEQVHIALTGLREGTSINYRVFATRTDAFPLTRTQGAPIVGVPYRTPVVTIIQLDPFISAFRITITTDIACTAAEVAFYDEDIGEPWRPRVPMIRLDPLTWTYIAENLNGGNRHWVQAFATNVNAEGASEFRVVVPIAPPPTLSQPQVVFQGDWDVVHVNVTWQTDVRSDSEVDWGYDASYSEGTQSNGDQVTDHRIEIRDVQPSSPLFLRLRSTNTGGVGDPLELQRTTLTRPTLTPVQLTNVPGGWDAVVRSDVPLDLIQDNPNAGAYRREAIEGADWIQEAMTSTADPLVWNYSVRGLVPGSAWDIYCWLFSNGLMGGTNVFRANPGFGVVRWDDVRAHYSFTASYTTIWEWDTTPSNTQFTGVVETGPLGDPYDRETDQLFSGYATRQLLPPPLDWHSRIRLRGTGLFATDYYSPDLTHAGGFPFQDPDTSLEPPRQEEPQP